jgi:hypothetical protein
MNILGIRKILRYLFFNNNHNAVILISILARSPRIKTKNITNKNRNLRILNKFLKGVKIMIINPATLLIKNRG